MKIYAILMLADVPLYLPSQVQAAWADNLYQTQSKQFSSNARTLGRAVFLGCCLKCCDFKFQLS
jgi:hypothetical protein